MNFEQVKGILERVVTVGITYAVAKGYVPAALAGDITNWLVLGASVAIGWYVNRSAALAVAAAKTA